LLGTPYIYERSCDNLCPNVVQVNLKIWTEFELKSGKPAKQGGQFHNLRYVQSSRPWHGHHRCETTGEEWWQEWGVESVKKGSTKKLPRRVASDA
jgi:hypothetical protein